MSTAKICDGCGEPIEEGTAYSGLVTWDITHNEDGTEVNGASTRYDFHAEHLPTREHLTAGSGAGTT